MSVMTDKTILILAGDANALTDLRDHLPNPIRLQHLIIDAQNRRYDFGPHERSLITKAQAIVIHTASIPDYSPLLLSYMKTLNKRVPLILLQRCTNEASQRALKKMGVNACLPLDVDPEQLLEVIALDRILDDKIHPQGYNLFRALCYKNSIYTHSYREAFVAGRKSSDQ